MKIGGQLPPLPQPGTEPKTKASFPDVAKTPTPAGPVPVPYPNVGGDSFERAGGGGLSSLLGKAGAKVWGDPHIPEAQRQLAGAAGRLLAQGDAAGGLAAWTEAVQHDPGVTIAELLPYSLDALAEGTGLQPEALVQHVLRESSQQSTDDLRSFAEKVKAFDEAKRDLRGAMETLREAAGGEGSELASLRMQAVMERRQKAIEAMSNLSKKLADTASAIVANMK